MGDALPRLLAPPKASTFIKVVRSLVVAKGDVMGAHTVCEERWPHDPATMILRAAISAGTIADLTWGAPLLAWQTAQGEFLEALRPASVFMRLANTKRVPFRSSVPYVTSSSSAYWLGEGLPIPASEMTVAAAQLGPAKLAALVVISQELARSSDPAAEGIIRQDLIGTIAAFIDLHFLGPQFAAVANVSPASVTNGVTPVSSSGSTAVQIAADLEAVVDKLLAAGTELLQPIWIMKPAAAAKLAAKMSTTGSPAFPDMRVTGGSLLGIPAMVSNSAPGSLSGGYAVILLEQSQLITADDGNTDISVSNEAALQMSDTPTGSASVLTPLWSNNLSAIKAIRWVNWAPRQSVAMTAAYLDGLAV